MADRRAKIQAEMERMRKEKAEGKGKVEDTGDAAAEKVDGKPDATTPKTRAKTPTRAPQKQEGGAEPPPVDPAKAAATKKRRDGIRAEQEKLRAAAKLKAAGKKRAATPERGGTKADGPKTGAKEARAALLKERQARQAAKKEKETAAAAASAAVEADRASATTTGTPPKAPDPQTPPVRPGAVAAAPAAAPAAADSQPSGADADSKKKKAMTKREQLIAAKKAELEKKRASKSKVAAGSAAVSVTPSEVPGPSSPPEPEPEPSLALEVEEPASDGEEPPPKPKTGKKQPTTPVRADDPPVNKTDILQRLHQSADTGNVPALQQAVEDAVRARVDVNTRDIARDNNTAVYLAASGGHARAVEHLHRHGGDLMLAGSMTATPLFIACYHGFADVVGVIVDNLPADERWRATRDYAVDGVIKIRRGDIFKPDSYKPNARGGFEGTVQGSEQDWPREGVARAKLPGDIFERTTERAIQLQKKVDNSSPFFIACQEGYVEVAKILLEAEVDIEEPDGQGATPFYSACQHGHLDIVRYLFGKENARTGQILDPNKGIVVNGVPETPRDTADRFGHEAVIAFLNEPYKSAPSFARAIAPGAAGEARGSSDLVPAYDNDFDDMGSDTDDERDLLHRMPGMGNDMAPSPLRPESPGRGPGVPDARQQEEPKLKTIKRGKTKTLDLAMKRRGSVYSAGFLVEDDESEEFEADGEQEDETRLRVTQLTRAVLFVGIAVFATLSHFAPGLLVLTAILSVLLIAAPAHYANADTAPGLPGGKTQRTVPAVQLGLCLFISIFAGAAQFVPGVLVILSTLILLLLAAPASKDDGTKKHTWR